MRDALVAIALFRAFGEGTLRLGGKPLGKSKRPSDATEEKLAQIDGIAKFWRMLEALERVLGVSFDPAAPCSDEDMVVISQIHRGLVEDEDAVLVRPLASFHIDFDEGGSVDQLESRVGEPGLSLSFVEVDHLSIMGAQFSVCEASVLVDMVLGHIAYDEDGDGAELYIDDAPGAAFKIVKKFYVTEREALGGLGDMYQRHAEYKQEE